MKKIVSISILSASLLLAGSINFNEADQNPTRINPARTGSVLSFHSSIENAKKSVVNIATKKTVQQNQALEQMFNNPLLRQFFGKNFQIPKSKRQAAALGSGVIISKDGYIVTNNHVVEDADEVTVTLLDNQKEYKAKVIGTDPDSDLAVIKIDAKNLHEIQFANSKNILEGDLVFAIGNPFGVGGAITQGIVSALNKSGIGLNNYENFIQTDASINPGNSGGALVDSRGALIGINSAILSKSGGNNGIGFAIPSNMVKTVARALIENGKIERGYMGVNIGNLDKNMKEVYSHKEGALITNVQDGEPAQKAGLKRGDLIIKVNGKDIEDANELKNTIGALAPGENVNITYERDNRTYTASMKLDKLSSNRVSKNGTVKSTNGYLKGASLATINDKIRATYKIPKDVKGVIILDIKSKTKADKAGFEQGDIIVQIEQNQIKNVKDLNNAFKTAKRKKIRVWINRGGYVMPILVK